VKNLSRNFQTFYFIGFFVIIAVIFTVIFPGFRAFGATGPPQIISYQGRLTDSDGDLLGGSGTTHYFRFSIYDASSGGSKLWPSGTACSHSRTVREGVFTAGIGDTSECADVLDFNFNDNDTTYLEVEVSTDDSTFETLTPPPENYFCGLFSKCKHYPRSTTRNRSQQYFET